MDVSVSKNPTYGNAPKRIVAGLIDLCVVALIYLVLSIPGILVFAQAIIIEGPFQTFAVYLIAAVTGSLCVVCDLLYRVLLPYMTGYTIGSAFLGMKLRTLEGEKASLPRLLVRSLCVVLCTLLSLGAYYLAEVICLLFSKEHLDCADILSGTAYVMEGERIKHV